MVGLLSTHCVFIVGSHCVHCVFIVDSHGTHCVFMVLTQYRCTYGEYLSICHHLFSIIWWINEFCRLTGYTLLTGGNIGTGKL